MAVKLDVSVNWITNMEALEKDVRNVNSRLSRITRGFNRDYVSSSLTDRIHKEIAAIKEYDNVFNRVYADLERLNKKGELSYYLGSMFPKTKGQTELTPYQLYQLSTVKTEEELERIKWQQKHDEDMAKRAEANEQKMKEQMAKEDEYWRRFYHPSEEEQEELDELYQWTKGQKELNKNTKGINTLLKNILKGRWAAVFGTTIAGAAIYGAYRLLKAGTSLAYSTSMQGLDWERTIRGGAAGGAWFGKDIAAYQRAGIGAANIQNFKRSLQGYIGSVKLGMGNAAPLMYLGLNALSNPDQLEVQAEKALRRLPEDISLALAQQIGLDYSMWDAIRSGRLDRSKPAYSEEAIQKWSKLADSFNDLITNLKTFAFNTLAPVAEKFAMFIDTTLNKGSSWGTMFGSGGFLTSLLTSGFSLGSLGYAVGQMIRFGNVEVVVKDPNGNVLGTGQSQVLTNGYMEVPQQ